MGDTCEENSDQCSPGIEIEVQEEKAQLFAHGVKEIEEEEEEEEEVKGRELVSTERPSRMTTAAETTSSLSTLTEKRERLKDRCVAAEELPLSSCPVVMLDICTDAYYEDNDPDCDPLAPDTVGSGHPEDAEGPGAEVKKPVPAGAPVLWTCPLCQDSFDTYQTMSIHSCQPGEATSGAGGGVRERFPCGLCGRVFVTHTALNWHSIKKHLRRIVAYCSWCTKGYPSMPLFMRHKCTRPSDVMEYLRNPEEVEKVEGESALPAKIPANGIALLKRHHGPANSRNGVKVSVIDTDGSPQINNTANGYSEEALSRVLDPLLMVKSELCTLQGNVILGKVSESTQKTQNELSEAVPHEPVLKIHAVAGNVGNQDIACSVKTGAVSTGKRAPQSPVWCPVCRKQFVTWRSLDDHLMDHLHIMRECDHCSRHFSKGMLLMHHVCGARTDTAHVCYLCPGCKEKCRGEEAFLKHFNKCVRSPQRDPSLCKACGKRMANATGLRKHVEQMHLSVERCACGVCGKFFDLRTAKQHLRLYHAPSTELRHQCRICEKRFRTPNWLTRHMSSIHFM